MLGQIDKFEINSFKITFSSPMATKTVIYFSPADPHTVVELLTTQLSVGFTYIA